MSGKSKKSVAPASRPFSPDVLEQAERIAGAYQVIVACQQGHWYGRGLELPQVFGDGKTVNECVADTREALAGAVALMLEARQKPPAPAREGRRTQQVNVRVTPEEKAMLESGAQKKGYQGLSDFIRAVALASVQ